MLRYVLKRFAASVVTILILVTAVFFLIRALPGDPFTSEKLTPEIRQNLMRYYGFDRPLHEQYLKYLANLLRGDLGMSLSYQGRTVGQIIADSFPYSADLGLRALALGFLAGILLGTLSALHRGRFFDYFCIFIAILGVSLPDFIVGYLLQYVFGLKLRLLPVALWRGFSYTILPTLALSLYTLSLTTRIMRTSMLDVVGQDYVRVARAKGLPAWKIVRDHELRNAILPVVTVMGPVTAAVLTGTFIIESIYAIPGMGKFYVLGIQNLDYSLVLGLTVFYGIFLVAANFAVDILYGLIDPRIRVEGSRG